MAGERAFAVLSARGLAGEFAVCFDFHTNENLSAIADKIGALDDVRNDVALNDTIS